MVHFFLSLMNGKRTVNQLWDSLNTKFGDDSPTQDEVIQLLAQLHYSEIIMTDVTPQIEELFQRAQKEKMKDWKKRFSNPIALRFSLLDPDRILSRLQPFVGWIFTKLFAVLCVAFLIMAGINAVSHWGSLSHYASHNLLSTNNLLILWLVYPVMKLIHELGHAAAVKTWGGEVHEMGVMFLYFTPVPYVDASASAAFRSTYKRVVVSAAGIISELLLAAVALFVWLNVEPGIVQEIAFNVMLIGGVSTLLFNGNPLMRYDAYYMLSDVIGIPNLANRSNKHIGYIILRHIFGAKEFTLPSRSGGEALWFIVYGLSSFCYRMFILCFILLFITKQYFFIGVALGVWIALSQVAMPLAKHIMFVLTDSRMKRRHLKVWASSILFFGVFYHVLFNIPIPYATVAEGVVWLDDNAQIRTSNDGFVSQIHFIEGDIVLKGDVLVDSVDPLLNSKVFALSSELSQLELEYRSEWNKNRTKRKIIKEQIESVKSEIKRINEISDSLTIRSPGDGEIIVPNSVDLVGQYLEKGSLIGYILDDSRFSARLLVTQDNMNLIKKTDKISVRFVDRMNKEFDSSLIRIVPAATEKLPNAILGEKGGGEIKLDPKDTKGLTAVNKHFEIWITLPSVEENLLVGSRVYVKFSHEKRPFIASFERWIDQLLLRQFNV